ncbi:MAG TPA: hypothetical protein VGN20_02275 [Mucilaginibacter sp.]|jgi:hypothetical protein
MKIKRTLIIIAGLTLGLYACKKDGSNLNPSSLVGKWNVVSDSTFVGVGVNNHPVDYHGQPGDYFDFRTDGHVYTKEGTAFDTLSYSIVSNTGIIIQSFGLTVNGVPETSNVTLTANNAVIDAPTFFTPGGAFGRKVTLSR